MRAALLALALAAAPTLEAQAAAPAPEAQASSVITHGSRSRPWVALTFDDGWSAKRCGRIVRTLRAKRAVATFLINGSIVRSAPKRWRSMLKGFPFANHTLTHPWLTRLSTDGIRAEIAASQRVHERILRRPMLRLVRPPYGAYDGRVVAAAGSLGYRTLLWDTDAGDTWPGATTTSVVRNATRGGNGAIVLLHCGPAVTPGAVGPIIDRYRARGFTLVGLDRMFGGAAPRSPKACRVRNRVTGVVRGSLRAAIGAATEGHRLTVRGTCRGTTAIGKDVRIRGVRTQDSGPPTLDGRARGSVVTVGSAATVSIGGLRIIGGKGRSGGGIDNRGGLTLRDVLVRGNAAGDGGGILNRAGARLNLRGDTSIRRNRASARGGGVLNRPEAVLRMKGSSAIRRNTAGRAGGGVSNARAAVLSLGGNASIQVNSTAGDGGGVHTGGRLVMRDSGTIRGNEAAAVGGVYHWDGELLGVDCGVNVAGNAPDDCGPT